MAEKALSHCVYQKKDTPFWRPTRGTVLRNALKTFSYADLIIVSCTTSRHKKKINPRKQEIDDDHVKIWRPTWGAKVLYIWYQDIFFSIQS